MPRWTEKNRGHFLKGNLSYERDVNLDYTEYEVGVGTRARVAVQVAGGVVVVVVVVVVGAGIGVRVAVTIGVEGRIGVEAVKLGICFSYSVDP